MTHSIRRTPKIEDDGSKLIEATVSTAGYAQPNEALRYSSSSVVPKLDNLLDASTEPLILYSHAVSMRQSRLP